ncbi:NADH-quinone oxidoreductase subunit NuoG [Xanthomonas sp. MUS 060]|uniref:NADH-quinone oxidoreductase subunit NuoG n=1 Tax=Xanthomonas sp. MUS 060 TaxID=1588031 RepID=UPI0005F2F619|nr:NADH-quinone oxidoreductase subunit NuoG [Xanthomonas sp. MUS 060]
MSAQPNNPGATPAVVPEGHVTVEIDGQSLVVPKGAMIIQAADKAGIPIPRFCYHEKLPIAANCRMCLVDVEKSPKPSPACATPVMDGMKVQTRSDKALKYQRSVMEFLLINHPLDCPICDQGGECELQDVSLGYGRSVSRFNERKRVVADEDIGPLVATEMTRCIQCTRCVRFTADIAGTYELGGMYRGENLQIGTYDGKPLTTELSGNVIDVCPVGALTNKVFQFRARPWELTARESLGYHDAMGSNLFLHVRRGEVLRTVPRDNEAVNECWLSDRDRYSHQGLYAEDRALRPLRKVDGQWREVSWAEGLAAAGEILKANRGDALGVLAHPSTSNEEGALLARLADGLDSGNLDHRVYNRDFSDAALAEPFALPLEQIEQAEVVVILGSNLRHELPLLHARIRKAQMQRHTQVYAINPVDFEFTFDLTDRQIVAPSRFAEVLADGALRQVTQAAARAVLIVGALAENHPQAAALRAAARDFAAATGAALCRIPQGANALGLARYGVLPRARNVAAMLEQPRSAYVLYGLEPGLDFADAAASRRALAGAKVVAFSHFACASTRDVADVILPIGALPEIEATLTNLDGDDQRTRAGGKLPGEAREGWRVLRALGGELGLPGFAFTDLAGLRDSLQPREVAASTSPQPLLQDDGLELAASPAIYRTDAVVRRAPALQQHPLNRAPSVTLHPQDATRLGLHAGQMVKVGTAAGSATLPLETDQRVAPGAAWIETGHGATAPLGAGRVTVVAA